MLFEKDGRREEEVGVGEREGAFFPWII